MAGWTLVTTVIVLCGTLIPQIQADFFSELDKLDIDSQLNEIDKMIDTIDADEDEAMDSMSGGSYDNTDSDSATDALADLFGGECKYTCNNGATPKPKPQHKPASNGCGSFGIQFELEELPEMTSCCNQHDFCYDTCNSDRSTCDKNFKQCLHGMCNKIQSSVTKQQFQGCKDTANLMYTGTMALGCSPYLESQQKACVCDTPVRTSDKSRSSKQSDSKKTASKAAKTDKQREARDTRTKENVKPKSANKDRDNIRNKQKSGRPVDEL